MKVQCLMLTVIATIILLRGAGEASAVMEVGDLQAVTVNGPPFIFRLPLTLHASLPPRVPAVIVHRPADVLASITPTEVEFRLHTLNEVEVELRHESQTLNRLFPIVELEAARAQLRARLTWGRYQAATAKVQEPRRLASILDEVRQAHQTWAQFDPIRAHQAMSRVERAALDLGASGLSQRGSGAQNTTAGEAMASSPATGMATEQMRVEGEVRLIREEIHRMVGHVRPWMPTSHRSFQGETALTPLVGVTLGGLFAAGIASLYTGVLVRRRALYREPQRQRLFTVTMARARGLLPSSQARLALLTAYPPSLAGVAQDPRQPWPGRQRRRRVAYKVRRRVRLRRVPQNGGTQPVQDLARRSSAMPVTNRAASPSIALIEMLAQLQREIISLRRLLPRTSDPHDPDPGSHRAVP